jgi:hypothetical protein
MKALNRIEKNRATKKRAALVEQVICIGYMILAVAFIIICTYWSL